MSHNLRENDEDVSNLDDIFDDNKGNIDKFSKDDESAVSDSELSEDNKKNGSGPEIVQEESASEHKEVSGGHVRGEEEKKGVEEVTEEESDTTSTSTTAAAT